MPWTLLRKRPERTKARSQALDDVINSRVLTDNTLNNDEIEKELEKLTVQKAVEEELAKLKSERERKRKQVVEQEAQH